MEEVERVMTMAVIYDKANGKIRSVVRATRSDAVNPQRDKLGAGTFGLVSKAPKELATMDTLRIVKECRVKDVFSNQTVEIEIGKKT